MTTPRLALALVCALGWLATSSGPLAAQDHPMPSGPSGSRQTVPERPATMAEVEQAIQAHVDKKSEKNKGGFPVKDKALKKNWALQLDRVHTDKLTQLNDDTYFACVDFKADDGNLVDVDFYLRMENGRLKVKETTVHKVNGEARFVYEQQGDRWKRIKVKS